MSVDLSDWLSTAEQEALQRPTGEASGLPGRVYSDPAFLELERKTLFRTTWVAAAVASQLPEAGDALPVDVAGWSLLLVRNRTGEIKAFHNICRHRNAAVVPAPARKLAGLRCPWHGWTYDLDGTLKGTPEFGGVGVHETAALNRARLNLVPVRTAQWFDIVFVNIGGEAPPLETYLSSFLERFKDVEFDSLTRAGSWETTYPCNWKLAVESGIEDYHLPFLHPSITNGAVRGERSIMESDDDISFICGEVSQSQWAEGRGAGNLPRLPPIPGLQDDDRFTLFFLNLFPSAVIGMVPDSLYIGIWLPVDHQRTSLVFHHYFAGPGATDESYRPTRGNIISGVQEIFSQDTPVVEAVQRGARTRDDLDIGAHFSPFWETLIHDFQKTVVKHIKRGIH